MVERTSNGKFRLGLRLFDFGNRAIEQYDLRERAQPHLRRLVAETEETAHLCILEAARVIYIDKIEPARSVRMITRIGASNPVHCTSVGKAILAFLPPERAAEVIRRVRFERPTHRTIATPEALRAELEKTRRRGYAVDDEELEEGLRCIAVPLLDAQRQPVAAISHLRAFVPRDGAKTALNRESSAHLRARNLGRHGLCILQPRRPQRHLGTYHRSSLKVSLEFGLLKRCDFDFSPIVIGGHFAVAPEGWNSRIRAICRPARTTTTECLSVTLNTVAAARSHRLVTACAPEFKARETQCSP